MTKFKLSLVALSCLAVLIGCGKDKPQVIIVTTPQVAPTPANVEPATAPATQAVNSSNTSANTTPSESKPSDTKPATTNPSSSGGKGIATAYGATGTTNASDKSDQTNKGDKDKADKSDTSKDDALKKAQNELAEAKKKLEEAQKKAQDELAETKKKLEEAEAKLPKPVVESDFFKAVKASDGFIKDGTGRMEGRMRPSTDAGIDVFNGIVMTIDNAKSQAEGKVVLSTADGVKNGRSSSDSLTTFKLDDTTEVNLVSAFGFNNARPLKADDFSQGTFSGTGFVGGNLDSGYSARQALRYGVYTADGKSVLFVNGRPAGRVFEGVYMGNAIYGKDGQYKLLSKAVSANVSLSDRNALVGVMDIAITVGEGEVLKFGADISGNTFEGNRGDAETKGGFYDNGGDAGGIFHVTKEGDQKGYNGVFGISNKL